MYEPLCMYLVYVRLFPRVFSSYISNIRSRRKLEHDLCDHPQDLL